jgi:hypothetical protein
MELEFDKEIDAMLRKTRAGGASTASSGAHIDADAIAAFAENALPSKTRALYFEHFADCDPCRKLLARSAAWPPAESKNTAVSAAVTAVSAPWYAGIFRAPNLAMAMAVLVLLLGGVLAFLFVNRRSGDGNATVAGVMNSQTRADGISTAPAEEPAAAMSNSANSAVANTAANAMSDTSAAANKPAAPPAAPGGRGPSEDQPASTSAEGFTLDGSESSRTQPKTAAPPPAAMAQPPTPADERERKDDADKEKQEAPAKGADRDAKMSARSETTANDSLSRDGAPLAMKKAGPNRNVGPRQGNVQENNVQGVQLGAGAARIKNAGGKKFELNDGVWYDTAYHGQATKNYRRSSADYQKLDAGLRSIASSVGGVVVIVWKGSAYRIQ